MDWSPKVGQVNRTLRDSGFRGAVLVGAEVGELLLDACDVPPSQVVSQPHVKLVECSGFLDTEPFLFEVAEEPFHDGVVETSAFAGHRLGESRVAQRVSPLGVAWSEWTRGFSPGPRASIATRRPSETIFTLGEGPAVEERTGLSWRPRIGER